MKKLKRRLNVHGWIAKELIDSSEYELELSKYIHLNPLKANMVERLEDYQWSSYPVYVFIATSTLVTTKQILSYFPDPQSQHYEKYIKSGNTEISLSDNKRLFLQKEEFEKEEQL